MCAKANYCPTIGRGTFWQQAYGHAPERRNTGVHGNVLKGDRHEEAGPCAPSPRTSAAPTPATPSVAMVARDNVRGHPFGGSPMPVRPPKTRLRQLLFVVTILLGLVAAACGNTTESGTSASTAAPTTAGSSDGDSTPGSALTGSPNTGPGVTTDAINFSVDRHEVEQPARHLRARLLRRRASRPTSTTATARAAIYGKKLVAVEGARRRAGAEPGARRSRSSPPTTPSPPSTPPRSATAGPTWPRRASRPTCGRSTRPQMAGQPGDLRQP